MQISSREPVSIVSSDTDHCVAVYGHVLLLCFGDLVSIPALRATRKAHFDIMERHPAGIGCLTIALATRSAETPINECVELVRATYKNVRWAACVIMGEGFVASTSRAVLTSLLTLSGQVSLVRAFRNVPSALTWQEKHASGLGVLAPQLDRATQQALASMVPARAANSG